MSAAPSALTRSLRKEMSKLANPERAAAMRAYMKSTMPYYGLSLPQVRDVCKSVLMERDLGSCAGWKSALLELWRGARRREERYAALYLLREKRYRDCVGPGLMPMIEEMVETGAWWDVVDELVHTVGELLRSHPEEIKPVMRAWSTDPNLWKRRVAIICQLSFKEDTDLELLYDNIEPNLGDREFFIRKAIGWALRQYAHTDPQEVARYVRAHEAELSGLSRREALKNFPAGGEDGPPPLAAGQMGRRRSPKSMG
ncbi:MAG TPA: DNA alkylation repair protein [Candidatus Dormibacteraeota bacterium]|nr:DNA alkylation repair protein [Candidatus Dormibacteraeota bacterium]